MALSATEDTKLGAQALAYVIELYRELTVENGAPTLGTQNQAVISSAAIRDCAAPSAPGQKRRTSTKRRRRRGGTWRSTRFTIRSAAFSNEA